MPAKQAGVEVVISEARESEVRMVSCMFSEFSEFKEFKDYP